MGVIVPGVHLAGCEDLTEKDVDGRGPIGERSDAVLRTAIGERSDAVLRTAIGERSDAVLRTAMPGHDVGRSSKSQGPFPRKARGRARVRYFGAIDLNFSRSRMFILKPPGMTTSPGL
ncbi:MAG: hypothetical protein NTAFB05_03820 [Nitrobacter sp.]